MIHDIIDQCSIRSNLNAALLVGRPRCCIRGLAATLPCLCRPDPALAEPLCRGCPDPLRLGDRHHPGAAPAVAPHSDVHLVEPAAVQVAPIPLRVGRSVYNTPIVLEVVWDGGVTIAADEARNEGRPPQHVASGHRADVEAGQARVAGRVIEHGHRDSSSLHDTVWGQVNGLKCARG